ncbi:unnamed protein product [Medioppia subpectinata]|uniref:Phosducin domain-containing protein n=1 Tax=Medioppia subpectinata TaxID=1979941 RepID=A0A7R9KRV1_9ACAR|nr:unnamed protein product [Medioppia subpectinata]CAG2108658.1 unnamed protein product [Medioppia subpectinata]
MSTLEDKILGEKLHYYCSSSEEEDNDNEDDNNDCRKKCSEDKTNSNDVPPVGGGGDQRWNRWDGNSCNTGPKGVIKDWQRYKQFESEKRDADERQKLELMSKLSLSCRSHLDEELAKKENQTTDEDDLSDRFFAADIEKFLVEHGVLNESLIPNIITTRSSIRESAIDNDEEDDDCD